MFNRFITNNLISPLANISLHQVSVINMMKTLSREKLIIMNTGIQYKVNSFRNSFTKQLEEDKG